MAKKKKATTQPGKKMDPTFMEQQRSTGTYDVETQNFSSIKRIYAKNGMVNIDVYAKAKTKPAQGNPLRDTVLSVHDACVRAASLNEMAHKFAPKVRSTIMEIVDNVIAASREAQQQRDKGEFAQIYKRKVPAGKTGLMWNEENKVVKE